MPKIPERIFSVLSERGLVLAGNIVQNPSRENVYFIPLKLMRRGGDRKIPSGATLATVKEILEKEGLLADFILVDELSRDIEESLRASLMSSFPEGIRNSFVSNKNGAVQAWLEFKRPMEFTDKIRLIEHLEQFSKIFSVENISVFDISEENIPTRLEILSVVRKFSPVTLDKIIAELTERGLAIPSSNWMFRRLDLLCKSNMILRRQDEAYALTRKALLQLGTKKDARSPDVHRLLALARRGF